MRKLSKQNYDDVETRIGASHKDKVAAFAEKLWLRNRHVGDTNNNMKISKFHKNLLKIESMATKTNIVALLIFGSLFCYFVLPFLMYTFYVVDSNILGGWVHEPLSPFAKTTNEKNYYTSENIKFHTIDDVKKEKKHYE